MKRSISPALGKVLTAAFFSLSPFAAGANIVEYFNDYGNANVSMNGGNLNGGSGWAGSWTSATGNSYVVGTVPNYAGAGYSATGNDSNGNDGAGAGSGTGTVGYRTFSTALTGTVWISAAVHQTAVAKDILLWLDMSGADISGGNREFIALRGSTGTSGGSNPEPVMSYNGAGDSTSNNTDYAINTTHHFLARIDMNVSGANDSISFWINPDLTNGIAGLGTAIYSGSGADAYGTAFEGIGISGNGAESTIDAIRISNEADAFDFVISGIPEPSSSLLILSGGILLLTRRQNRR